ncbi:head maturation protease, ClpP-related [Bacillus sp. T33-2]|uniref:head maturation protease, ClpP-related n=1 Tax=Bacillus sp. T33-2 TaxID=2054168 RepID=UPI000C779F09|nr:head maturation protease, ClpP-related [Bacillus sp. T33-2]PLR93198.1 Clp protease ClpP [Bacillus sp. T33-2]
MTIKWEFKAAAEPNVGELYIYGDIVTYRWEEFPEDHNAKSFKDELDALGEIDELKLYINSPGGSVHQGSAIYSILKRHKAKKNVYIDGLGASIASVIAMSGDTIFMPQNAMMMIHNPWTYTWGNANELRKIADDLDKMRESMITTYLSKAGDKLDRDTLIDLLDKETWLTAQECFNYGLCDVIEESIEIAACANKDILSKFKNTPKNLLEIAENGSEKPKNDPKNSKNEQELRKKLIEEARSNLETTNLILGGLNR